jgi:hypothetical protein
VRRVLTWQHIVVFGMLELESKFSTLIAPRCLVPLSDGECLLIEVYADRSA